MLKKTFIYVADFCIEIDPSVNNPFNLSLLLLLCTMISSETLSR